jgi:hypothetical protein
MSVTCENSETFARVGSAIGAPLCFHGAPASTCSFVALFRIAFASVAALIRSETEEEINVSMIQSILPGK